MTLATSAVFKSYGSGPYTDTENSGQCFNKNIINHLCHQVVRRGKKFKSAKL